MDDTTQRDPQTFAIIGAAMTVHRELGHGFLEAVYQEALEREFVLQDIPYEREVLVPISYRGEVMNTTYRADFVCFGDVVIEMKALKKLSGIDEAQLINYLKATGFNRGLLINFGAVSLDYRRRIFTR